MPNAGSGFLLTAFHCDRLKGSEVRQLCRANLLVCRSDRRPLYHVRPVMDLRLMPADLTRFPQKLTLSADMFRFAEIACAHAISDRKMSKAHIYA